MREIKFASHRTLNRNRVLSQVQIVLPFGLVLELNPGTDGAVLVFYNGHTSSIADYVMVLRDEIEANVIFLAREK